MVPALSPVPMADCAIVSPFKGATLAILANIATTFSHTFIAASHVAFSCLDDPSNYLACCQPSKRATYLMAVFVQ